MNPARPILPAKNTRAGLWLKNGTMTAECRAVLWNGRGCGRLLADIDAGLIDMIIVYKIDRLTRSLGDFSKIVDRLDAANASFVSVTQSFNTATSMGRLTLNMLLSFAQFEREVTAERIRDKIAASKAKGSVDGRNRAFGLCPESG